MSITSGPVTRDPLRILMISDVYFPRINGVSTSIQTFALELRKLGHEVTLLAPDYGEAAAEPFEVIRIPARSVPMDPEDRLMSYRAIKRMTSALTKRGFDLIHIQTPFAAHYAGLHLARQLGIRTVETYHTFFEEYLDKYVPLLPSSLLRLIARRFSSRQCNAVNTLVVPSRAMMEVLQNYGVTTPVQVIPTGIRLEQFQQGDGERFRDRFAIPRQQPLLLYVGRVAQEKNIQFLVEVLARVVREVPTALLLITGEGPARESLENQARNLGLSDHVRFVGYLNRQGELEDCYSAADLFLFASRTETQGLVLLESMALGTPVVSTAVMGTAEVLMEGEGCRIAREELADFSGKVLTLLKNEEERKALGLAAQRYVDRWSAPAMAQKMETLYTLLGREWSTLKIGPHPAPTTGSH